MTGLSSSEFFGEQDAELWRQLIAGEKPALGVLFDRYVTDLLVYGFRVCGDTELTKDAIQDVFVDLWSYRANLNPEVQVRFYLYRCLRNMLIRTLKAGKWDPVDVDGKDYGTDTEPSAETRWMLSENALHQDRQLNRGVESLSEREREVISLKYYSGMKLKEIAALLDLREQTIANTLQNALTKLRKHLVTGMLWVVFCFL